MRYIGIEGVEFCAIGVHGRLPSGRWANLLQSAAQANGIRGRAPGWCPISSSPVTRRVNHGASTCYRQVGVTKSAKSGRW
jgi:hypothetical protein